MSIYADHNATAPIYSEVITCQHELSQLIGNAASLHRYGRYAQSVVEQAKSQVAALVNASPEQIFFTSGATEANNWVIKGMAFSHPGLRLAVSATEHEAILRPAEFVAEYMKAQLTLLPVTPLGRVEKDTLVDTQLTSIMWANNETGVINDIQALAEKIRIFGGMLHSDAAQVCGKIPIDFSKAGVDFMSLSSHKLGGPMGVGALVVKDPYQPLIPLLHGGGHQEGLRSGTENIPGIGAFGLACEIAAKQLDEYQSKTRLLRDSLEESLLENTGITIFAQSAERLPNTSFFAMEGVSGEMAVMSFDKMGIAVSGGAACGRHHAETASHVLQAMGVSNELSDQAVRVSFGINNSIEDVKAIVSAVLKISKQYPIQARRLG